jgi:hypothetical protein
MSATRVAVGSAPVAIAGVNRTAATMLAAAHLMTERMPWHSWQVPR